MKKTRGFIVSLTVLALVLTCIIAGCSLKENPQVPVNTTGSATQVIKDMAGREVTIPMEISRIATVGAGPALNSLIFTVGQGDKIVNGLPDIARNERWKLQLKFGPNIAKQPVVQMANGEPNVEELLKLKPDVVFTMDTMTGSDEESAKLLTNVGLPVIHLVWSQPEDVKQAINLVGQVLNREAQAQDYIKYFDDTVARVNGVIKDIPVVKRPRVLYCNVQTMTAPHAISDWWIEQAGGISVAKENRIAENIEFSMEQMLKWDPQVIVVSAPGQVKALYNDKRFKEISAVKNRQVYATPMGAHIWASKTAEQPLMLLWATKTFYPEEFKDLDLNAELISFYQRFFNYSMNAAEAQEILSGGA